MTFLSGDYYSKDKELNTLYKEIVDPLQGIVGEWTPRIIGSTTEGVGTYTHAYGTSLCYGQVVDIWFDIFWTVHTGTGFMRISLPMTVYPLSTYLPFVGTLQWSHIALDANYTFAIISGKPDTEYCEVAQCSPNPLFGTKNVDMSATGLLRGYLRFLRKYDK